MVLIFGLSLVFLKSMLFVLLLVVDELGSRLISALGVQLDTDREGHLPTSPMADSDILLVDPTYPLGRSNLSRAVSHRPSRR